MTNNEKDKKPQIPLMNVIANISHHDHAIFYMFKSSSILKNKSVQFTILTGKRKLISINSEKAFGKLKSINHKTSQQTRNRGEDPQHSKEH